MKELKLWGFFTVGENIQHDAEFSMTMNFSSNRLLFTERAKQDSDTALTRHNFILSDF